MEDIEKLRKELAELRAALEARDNEMDELRLRVAAATMAMAAITGPLLVGQETAALAAHAQLWRDAAYAQKWPDSALAFFESTYEMLSLGRQPWTG